MKRFLGVAVVLLTAAAAVACGDPAAASKVYYALAAQALVTYPGQDAAAQTFQVRTVSGPLVDGRLRPIANTLFETKCFTLFAERSPIAPYFCSVILKVSGKLFAAEGYLTAVKSPPPWSLLSPPLSGMLRSSSPGFTMSFRDTSVVTRPTGQQHLLRVEVKP
jgi:hypothetical protein